MVSTRAPSLCHISVNLDKATSSVLGSGVSKHQRSLNNSAKPDSGPDLSVPATGCPGIK